MIFPVFNFIASGICSELFIATYLIFVDIGLKYFPHMQTDILKYVKGLKLKGHSTNEIAAEFSVNPSTVRRWLSGEMEPKVNRIHYVKPNDEVYLVNDGDNYSNPTIITKSSKASEQSLSEEVENLLSSLAPIHYPAPTIPKVYQAPNKIAMVIGDMHFGAEDWNVLDLFFKAVEELKPETIVLNGDTLDLFAVSRYPKDIRHTQTLTYERNAYHKFLKILHDVTAPFKTKIYECEANHSGNGQHSRWWRYLSNQIKEISELDIVKENLSYEKIFFPSESWNRVKLVEHVELTKGFIIAHGDVVRKKGGMSAVGLLEKWYCSMIVNHTHRMGSSFQRLPSIGTQEERIIRVYENGCSCKIEGCSYASAVNWQNGFSVVNYSDKNVAVEQCLVENKAVSISTLGKTLRV